MNFKLVARIIAYILIMEVAGMIPGFAISAFGGETMAVHGYLLSFGVIAAVVAFLMLATIGMKNEKFYAREGLLTTGLAWIIMSALGCLPFFFSGEIPNYVDCLFEMVSGFTTTGSSILTSVEDMSKGLLWWRSFSHWVGGMGVLVFLMAIVSLGGKNQGYTLHLMRAESPGPASGKMVPRMRQTAAILYWMYVGLTVLDVIFLLLGGMSPFEAFCCAFGTAGTGGFGVKNDSMASYSVYLQNVTTVFMLLFSVNFSVYYLILMKKFKDAFGDEEFKTFWIIVFVCIGLISWNVRPFFSSIYETVQQSAFTVATIISTTGYGTADFNLWPSFSKTIIIFLMFMGACAGSTGGGIKQVRVMILWKNMRRNIHKFLHPSEVRSIQFNGRAMDEGIVENVNMYLVIYVAIIIVSVLAISLDGFSFETNFTAVMATFNNIGPGMDVIGPTSNFSAYSNFAKLVLTGDMLAGRLEIYPILVLFSKSTWKRAR